MHLFYCRGNKAAHVAANKTAPKGARKEFCMKKQKVLMAVLAVAFVLGSVVPAAAQAAGADLIVGNRTGKEITRFTLSASGDSAENENHVEFRDLQVSDGSWFSPALPDHLKGAETFQVAIASGLRRYETKDEVIIDFNKGTPVLELVKAGNRLLNLPVSLPYVILGGFPLSFLYTITALDIISVIIPGKLEVQVGYMN